MQKNKLAMIGGYEMAMHKNEQYNETIELPGILGEFREALKEEIQAINDNGHSTTILRSGKRIENRGAECWYRFSVEYAPTMPADTPCKLKLGEKSYDVNVISFEENSITISSKTPLPDAMGSAHLENGATVLMERLIKRIEDDSQKPNHMGEKLLAFNGKIVEGSKLFSYSDLDLEDNNTESQNKAIRTALSNDVTFIWGPPGTGKTSVIGQIIDQLYRRNRSVLVASHTNTAVDGAIEKADKAYTNNHIKNESEYPILRIGTPSKLLPERVLLQSHIKKLGKELYERESKLETQKAELQQLCNDVLTLLSKKKWISDTNLSEIQALIQRQEECEFEERTAKEKASSIKKSIQKEKEERPKYFEYTRIIAAYEEKRVEYDSVIADLQENENKLKTIPNQTRIAKDEVKKHTRYADLKEQESHYMSPQFIQEQIDKINEELSSLETEIERLESIQNHTSGIIEGYEQKGSIARFFGKSAKLQAEMDLNAAKESMISSREQLKRKEKEQLYYKDQLEQALILQDQIRAVIPSHTKEYWEHISVQLENELIKTKQATPTLTKKEASIKKELVLLQREVDLVTPIFDAVSKLEQEEIKAQESVTRLQSEIKMLDDRCDILLKKEIGMCDAFLSMNSDIPNALIMYELLSYQKKTIAELLSIDINRACQEKSAAEKALIEINGQLDEVRKKLQELELQAVKSARIVGATLAKSYLSDTLRERKFDTVILDEASMASIPALWSACFLAEKRVIVVGDFLQLPPIVIAKTEMAQKWLGKDIFHHNRVQESLLDGSNCPASIVMLNEQFRMEPDIADIANMYYGEYGGLRSKVDTEHRKRAYKNFYSWYPEKPSKNNIRLIDTESLHAWCTGIPRGKSHSRYNSFSAAIDVNLAFALIDRKLKTVDPNNATVEEEPTVLIIAPYKPHAALLNQLIDLEYRNRGYKENLNHIKAGTVHSFQGSEADIVIFDLVVDEPHWRTNLFLSEDSNGDDLRQMFNVSITRARFKLFIVGNIDYCRKKAKENALGQLIDKLTKEKKLIKEDTKDLFPNITYARPSVMHVAKDLSNNNISVLGNSFDDNFLSDLCSFNHRMIIYSPFMTEKRIGQLLPFFKDSINAGKQIIVVTKGLDDRKKTELSSINKCEKELKELGVHIVHKSGMHEKMVFFDDDIWWLGSLNVLSFTGNTGEIMYRIQDGNQVRSVKEQLGIDYICKAIDNEYEQKCPICGKEMLLKESAKGGNYWECETKDYSRSCGQQYPIDGVIRCSKCGAPFVFGMKKEPRWICSNNPKHYQKMRPGDLRLKKMSDLIPTKAERKDVDRFFENKKKR